MKNLNIDNQIVIKKLRFPNKIIKQVVLLNFITGLNLYFSLVDAKFIKQNVFRKLWNYILKNKRS